MNLKKILSLLLSFLMILSTAPMVAFAEDEKVSTEVNFTAPEEETGTENAPKENSAPVAIRESDSKVIMIGDDYMVDLTEMFTDSDEDDILTYTVSVNGEESVAAAENYIFTPEETGEYTLVFVANDGTDDSEAYTVTLTVTEKLHIPESITVEHDAENVIDGVVIVKKGDKFNVVAYDENGDETPVTWKNTFYNAAYSFDSETGTVEVVGDVYSSTDMLYFTATSIFDESVVSAQTRIQVTGYVISESNKEVNVALSNDGQTAKTASVTAGKSGHNIWSYDIPEGVGELAAEPESSNSIKFNVFRPGVITATFCLDINELLTDTATVTVTGVAVEDADGNRQKTYLGINSENPNPTVQLEAFVEEGKTVEAWESADEDVATVDENGLVTAQGIGSTIITAVDSEGVTGGIKVVVQSEEIPYFENLQFLSSAIKDYSTEYVFNPTTTEYSLEIKTYSTTKLTLQNTTLYDAEKYDAVAEYVDADGENQVVEVNSGAITYLDKIPFDNSVVTITLIDKNNEDNKTAYTFDITRPRDTTKTIKSSGFVLVPDGRSLLATKYNGYAEGTMFKLTDDGEIKLGWGTNPDTGVSSTHYAYKCFALGGLEKFALTVTGSTVYEHLRYSIDGENWIELPQGGGVTDTLAFSEDENTVMITVQIIDDATYTDNVNCGKDGFADCEVTEYTVIVEQAGSSEADAQILTAKTELGDWYPGEFDKEKYTYSIVVPIDVTEETLTYTVSEGATVKLGTTEQMAEDGVYTLSLTTSQKSLTITSADGSITNTYNFKIQKKSEGYPDKVVDFLCINSQYTNGVGAGNAASPWVSLAGSYTSIGNFGGYITYYYEDALINNPNNKYGIDFYVYGNANKDTSTSTKTSFFEPAQAWVSEDGETWYALAGSAHYDEGVVWDYTVTYTKSANGKTAWTDSLGNSHDGASYSGTWPLASVYNIDELDNGEITLLGILLPARSGDVAVVGKAVDAYPVKWGYADCFVNGTKGKDVNPYADNTNFDLQTNGFDLEWAVDEEGTPVDVEDMEFHYVKLVTSSNIYHPSFGEKSPEIAGVLKTTEQEDEVGKTDKPNSITITDGVDTKVINLTENNKVYGIDIGDMKYFSIAVNGASEEDNIYVNNTRIAYDESADGFKVTKESGEKLVRVIVQNGDKEPVICLLKITGTATETDDLIENVKLDVDGSSRTCNTKDGETYTAEVGYRILSVGIYPVADSLVTVTINGEEVKDKYFLTTGVNEFIITGEKDGVTHTVTLKITKESAPASKGTITVYFTLLGDENHGESDKVHTLKNGGLETWIAKTAVEVESPATVLDVLTKALEGEHTFVNADGNYISEIDGLAEFTNGTLSGWMYTLNGKYPNKGVAEQSVKNGDKIVFHYTDDYTQEKGSEKWSSNSSHSTVKNTEETNTEVTSTPVFEDVEKGSWYEEAVNYVVKNNLFNGVSETEFAPDTVMTRAMLVTVLYRMENPEEKAYEHNFADVADGEWYTDAIGWAAENGVVKGMSETEFAPNDNITREQMAVVLYRYAKMKGYDVTVNGDITQFEDANCVSSWAMDAIKWANGSELIKGTSDAKLSPTDVAARAQVAVILMRFLLNAVK